MRLNLSRMDVDLLVKLIEDRQKQGKTVGLVERNRLFKVREQLLRFRDDVWGDTEKEVDVK